MASLKKEVKDALLAADFEKVADLAVKNKRVFRILISLAYDKEKLLCWRAIEAIGKAVGGVAENDPQTARNIVQRLLWSVREESGGVGWSAPEMLGEIVRNSPQVFADIPPIIFSFHEEEPFLKGVLWAMSRIKDTGGNSVEGAPELAMKCLDHSDPSVRGLAVWAASRLNLKNSIDKIRTMTGDKDKFKFYEGHELKEIAVGDMAQQVLDWPV